MQYLAQIFKDVDGQYSFKRFATFIALGLYVMDVITNKFQGMKLDDQLRSFNFYLILVGLGTIASEKFTSRTPPEKDTSTTKVEIKKTESNT
jgi:hypothetical protein